MYRRYNTGRERGTAAGTPAPPPSAVPKPRPEPVKEVKKTKNVKRAAAETEKNLVSSILNALPKEVYNRSNGKILGLLTAEDLFLLSLIFMLAERESSEDLPLIAALVYIFIAGL